MIYVIEIPHQLPPTAWVAINEADFISRSDQAYARCGDTPETDDADELFDAWVKYIRADLSSLLIYMTDEEAIAALDSTDFNRHGGAAARDKLLAKLRLHRPYMLSGDNDD